MKVIYQSDEFNFGRKGRSNQFAKKKKKYCLWSYNWNKSDLKFLFSSICPSKLWQIAHGFISLLVCHCRWLKTGAKNLLLERKKKEKTFIRFEETQEKNRGRKRSFNLLMEWKETKHNDAMPLKINNILTVVTVFGC